MRFSLRSLMLVALVSPPLLAAAYLLAGTLNSMEVFTGCLLVKALVVYSVCAATTFRPV